MALTHTKSVTMVPTAYTPLDQSPTFPSTKSFGSMTGVVNRPAVPAGGDVEEAGGLHCTVHVGHGARKAVSWVYRT